MEAESQQNEVVKRLERLLGEHKAEAALEREQAVAKAKELETLKQRYGVSIKHQVTRLFSFSFCPSLSVHTIPCFLQRKLLDKLVSSEEAFACLQLRLLSLT